MSYPPVAVVDADLTSMITRETQLLVATCNQNRPCSLFNSKIRCVRKTHMLDVHQHDHPGNTTSRTSSGEDLRWDSRTRRTMLRSCSSVRFFFRSLFFGRQGDDEYDFYPITKPYHDEDNYVDGQYTTAYLAWAWPCGTMNSR